MDAEHQSNEGNRRGRARERHLRRRERSGGMAQPMGLPRPQLRPAGGLDLPTINIPGSRLILYAVGAGLFLIAVILFIANLKPPEASAGPNAIWIGTQYTHDEPGEEQVRALAARLREHQIGTVFAWVSLLQSNNAWLDTLKLSDVRTFTEQFKAAYPDSQLLGWLSIDAQPVNGQPRLADEATRRSISDFSRRMTQEFGFDGVILNVVPVLDNDENYLLLLRSVRQNLGEGFTLAAAVPPDWAPTTPGVPRSPGIAPGTEWSAEYKQRVALIADTLVLAAYNSGLTDSASYSEWMAYQVSAFSQAVAELGSETRLLVGVPAYAAQLPAHDPAVENVAAAIAGIRSGLTGAGAAAALVRGLAVYAEWEMTEADWLTIREDWLQ